MAEETYFDKISAQIKTGTEPFQWYRNRIKELGTPNTAELLRSGKLNKQPTPKHLNPFAVCVTSASSPARSDLPKLLSVKTRQHAMCTTFRNTQKG